MHGLGDFSYTDTTYSKIDLIATRTYLITSMEEWKNQWSVHYLSQELSFWRFQLYKSGAKDFAETHFLACPTRKRYVLQSNSVPVPTYIALLAQCLERRKFTSRTKTNLKAWMLIKWKLKMNKSKHWGKLSRRQNACRRIYHRVPILLNVPCNFYSFFYVDAKQLTNQLTHSQLLGAVQARTSEVCQNCWL